MANILDLEDRLYTSTEVAKILGVSLRSVYRYLEDEKLMAEMKTATGRHRFTKQNILDFLSPPEKKEKKAPVASEAVAKEEPTVPEEAKKEDEKEVTEEEVDEAVETAEEVAEETAEDTEAGEDTGEKEDVDWLAKFRAAAEKYKAEAGEEKEEAAVEEAKEEVKEEPKAEAAPKAEESVSGLTDAPEAEEEVEEEPEAKDEDENYYTSGVGGLKDIAQNIDKSAKKASLDYAFTMDAGLSLHKPIRPFSLIHAYVRSEDLPFFEKILDLKPSSKSDGQLCLLVSDSDALYADGNEMHGLKVVSNAQLKKDLIAAGEDELAAEVD